MSVKKARKIRDGLLIGGLIIGLLTSVLEPLSYTYSPFLYLGFAVMFVGVFVHFRYNRCPHCGREQGRNTGDFCPHCGKSLDAN